MVHETDSRQNANDALQLQSLNRVLELPVIMSAWQMALERYEQLKHYSPLVESSLTRAEETAKYVADQSKPYVEKLERPISLADSLFVKGLDKIEELVPAIKKSPTELKTAGWEKIEEVKGFGNQKVDSIKAFGYDQVNQALASAYALAVMKYVDTAIDVTEQIVDRYLPPSKEESLEKPADDADIVRRLAYVTDKMRHRIKDQSLSYVHSNLQRLQETTGQVLNMSSNHSDEEQHHIHQHEQMAN